MALCRHGSRQDYSGAWSFMRQDISTISLSAVAMKDYLSAHGVPASQIIVDSHGDTTFDSARNTRDIAKQQKFQSVLVISQYFHLPRARLALERFHIARVYSAHAYFWEIRDLYSTFRETVGYLSYLRKNYD